jgi:hypothetical protein
VVSAQKFVAQQSFIERERPPYFSDLDPNDFRLFPGILCLKGTKTSKNCDSGTESCSTTGVPKIFPAVVASLG